MRQMLGHDGPPTNYWSENLVSGVALAECPLRTWLRAADTKPALVREISRHLDEHYPNYQAGFLLEAGGTADQPARYVAFMTAIGAMRAAQEKTYKDVTQPDDAPQGDA